MAHGLLAEAPGPSGLAYLPAIRAGTRGSGELIFQSRGPLGHDLFLKGAI
jgi:hypothetical protein